MRNKREMPVDWIKVTTCGVTSRRLRPKAVRRQCSSQRREEEDLEFVGGQSSRLDLFVNDDESVGDKCDHLHLRPTVASLECLPILRSFSPSIHTTRSHIIKTSVINLAPSLIQTRLQPAANSILTFLHNLSGLIKELESVLWDYVHSQGKSLLLEWLFCKCIQSKTIVSIRQHK